VKVRARSKPTIAAGPPVAVVKAMTTTTQSGAGPGQSRTAVHGTIIAATTPMTIQER